MERLYNACILLKQNYSNFKIVDYYSNETDKYVAFLIVDCGDNIEIIEKPKSEIVVVYDDGDVVKI